MGSRAKGWTEAAIGSSPSPDRLARAGNGHDSGFEQRAKPDRLRIPPRGIKQRINRSKCTRHYGRGTERRVEEFELRLSCFAAIRGSWQKSNPHALRKLPS